MSPRARERQMWQKEVSRQDAANELVEPATTEDFSVVRQEGARQVKRQLKHYNLDAIISVGYRVNSSRATRFRQWATGVLRQHLVEGYTLNQQRLKERGIEFEQALDLLSRTLANQQLVSAEGEAVLKVIADYARSRSLLQGYDEQSLIGQTGKQPDMRSLALDDVLAAIGQLKAELIAKGEATELFAHALLVSLRENVAVDWAHRESARARLRVLVKRILRKYGYPPDLQDAAVQTVLQQAEALSASWQPLPVRA